MGALATFAMHKLWHANMVATRSVGRSVGVLSVLSACVSWALPCVCAAVVDVVPEEPELQAVSAIVSARAVAVSFISRFLIIGKSSLIIVRIVKVKNRFFCQWSARSVRSCLVLKPIIMENICVCFFHSFTFF